MHLLLELSCQIEVELFQTQSLLTNTTHINKIEPLVLLSLYGMMCSSTCYQICMHFYGMVNNCRNKYPYYYPYVLAILIILKERDAYNSEINNINMELCKSKWMA